MTRSVIASAIMLTVLLVLPGSIHAASPDCAPTFRVGNVIQVGDSGCVYTYGVDAACNSAGQCPDGTTCATTGNLTFAWTVVKTGGTGSIAVDRTDWMRINVTVTPPVKYQLSCVVGGCSSCCVVPTTRECMTGPVTVPAKSSSVKSVKISRACE